MAIRRNNEDEPIDKSAPGRKWKYYSRQGGTLEDLEFVSVERVKRRASILLMGEDGAGKTSFATRYAPDPVVVVSFDGRSREAVKEAKEDFNRKVDLIEIFLTHKSLPPSEMKLHARDVLEKAMFTYETLVEESKKGKVRSILWDTATEFTEICKLAFDGTMEMTKEGAYGVDKDFIARHWWRILNLAKEDSNAHLIITARMSEIWKDDKPTGRFKPKCSRAVRSGVDLEMKIRVKGRTNPEFEIEVTNPKTNMEEMGEIYKESQWDVLGGPFVYACTMNYKNSIPDDWK